MMMNFSPTGKSRSWSRLSGMSTDGQSWATIGYSVVLRFICTFMFVWTPLTWLTKRRYLGISTCTEDIITTIRIVIIIAALIMHTFPFRMDVQGATYYYKLYPGRWVQFQDRTYSAQFPLPREFLAELPIMALQANALLNLSFASYRIPIYTPGWIRAVMWIKCLAEGQNARHWWESNPKPFDPKLRVQYNIQSTLPKLNSHKSKNRLSRRSVQVFFSLFSIVLTPHKLNFL